MAFDLMSIMNEQSRACAQNLPKYELKRLDIDWLRPDPENSKIYSIEKIEELADSIELAGGVLHNLVVRAKDHENMYTIISGERRWRALQMLVKNRQQKQYREVNCVVENEHDEDLLALMLIMTNSTTRELSDAEKMRQSQKLTEILQKMQAAGKVQGRIRDIVAKQLNVSQTQVARYQAIANNTKNDELKSAFDDGRLGVSAAYEASGLSEDGQQKVAAIVKEQGRASIDQVKEVKEKERAEQEAKKPVQVELPAMPKVTKELELKPESVEPSHVHYARHQVKVLEKVNALLVGAIGKASKEKTQTSYDAIERLKTAIEKNQREIQDYQETIRAYESK